MGLSKKKKKKKGNAFVRFIRFFLKCIFYGLLLSIVYILFCKWVNPPVTITQLGSALSGHGLKRDYISYDNMGTNIKLAVLAGEDQLYPDHNGFDFKSIQKAMKHNQTKKSLRGASTISQQVAKNVFLWQKGGWLRKGMEVYFTFMIEKIWGKQRILEMYLNVAEMGEGVFGVEAASQYYFRKHAKDLSAKEAAMIAACLPNPKVFTINPLSRRVSSRYPWIMRQMNNLKQDPDFQKIIQ
ncbi:MAG: monofunctional biosynthetic peptidoglycan transglycosylase [Ginsengibacter sp.]|jgi:monofunctional biosynthetic peptidoglycan transglycosylase